MIMINIITTFDTTKKSTKSGMWIKFHLIMKVMIWLVSTNVKCIQINSSNCIVFLLAGLVSDAKCSNCFFCQDELFNFTNLGFTLLKTSISIRLILDKYFHFSTHYKHCVDDYQKMMKQTGSEQENDIVATITKLRTEATIYKLRWDKENGVK